MLNPISVVFDTIAFVTAVNVSIPTNNIYIRFDPVQVKPRSHRIYPSEGQIGGSTLLTLCTDKVRRKHNQT